MRSLVVKYPILNTIYMYIFPVCRCLFIFYCHCFYSFCVWSGTLAWNKEEWMNEWIHALHGIARAGKTQTKHGVKTVEMSHTNSYNVPFLFKRVADLAAGERGWQRVVTDGYCTLSITHVYLQTHRYTWQCTDTSLNSRA